MLYIHTVERPILKATYQRQITNINLLPSPMFITMGIQRRGLTHCLNACCTKQNTSSLTTSQQNCEGSQY